MMKPYQHHWVFILGFTGTLAAIGQAHASGLQLTEQSVTGLGRAFAGGSLANDDASAAYYNPADMMLGKGTQAQAGFTFIGITTDASNAGSTTRLPANLGDVLTKPGTLPVFVTIPSSGLANDNGGEDNVVPNGYYITDINDRMRFGVSLNAPFAVSTSYGRNWVGRYHAVDSELTTIDVNPSIAYRVNDNLSLGFGVSAQYADVTLSQALFNPLSPSQDGFAEVEVDSWALGYNLGATYELDPNTRFGVSYRSRIKHSADGDRTISNYVPSANGVVSAESSPTLPDWLALAAYHRLNDQWAIMGSVRWTNWSLFKELKIEFGDGSQSLTEENWEDSWSFNIGVSYDYNPEWTFRAGYVYDQTPVPSAEFRTPRIPDSDRNAFAVGFSYHPNPQWSVDFGYMYLLFDDSSTDNTVNLLSTAPGLMTDTLRLNYESYGNLIGLQASYKF
ncbi:MAG TPA: TonB-dependent receptor [Candidatus Competibacteraceae bacterium]|nr:TonB-dependent receptor [Candidatus Competibacteraceae bacterium]HRZ06016.1 TonB-dependent receptor [Candidatus Competibacteraceae bacterium]HSA46397.1 TonB-dependent receptor [Candidatus Competibacteraceae bacterium]